MEARKRFVTSSRIKHEERIRKHLAGEVVEFNALWCSVGFFNDGGGRTILNEERPFTNEEWKKLLEDTHRPTEDWYFDPICKTS